MALGACGEAPEGSADGVTAADLQHHRWVLPPEGASAPVPNRNRLALDFGEQLFFEIATPCWQGHGFAALSGDTIRLPLEQQRKRDCPEPDALPGPERFSAASWRISIGPGRTLRLEHDATRLILLPSDWR
jgi:hypothetical protein